ncbi:MAG: hypothetical protein QNJ94_18740 [Alphaproteobacteria bacterium]|nr:hypothetical protein [Alphaproteobacteria bacterium]
MAIPTFVSAGTDAHGTGGVTPGLPAGLQDDDILILHIEGEGEDGNADSAPTGGDWTAIDGGTGSVASGTTGAADKTRHTLYWHRYDSASPPNRSVPDAGQHTGAIITAWRGCKTTGSPIHQTQSSSSSSNNSSISVTGVTTSVNDCLIVASSAAGDGTGGTRFSGWTNGNLSGLTERADFSFTNGSDGAIGVASGGLATAGSSGATTATFSTNEEEANWCIALEPEPDGPSITSIDSDDDTVDTRTGVTIAGSSFGASETGSAKVEVSNNATYGSGTVVEIDATSWSDTSITVDIEEEGTGNPLSDDFTLPLDPAYLWVTDSTGSRNSVGHQFKLKDAGATWLANKDTDVNIDVTSGNVQKRLRLEIDNSGGEATTPSFRWIYSKNSGAYATITASSSNIRTKSTTHFADGDDCDESLLGAGTLITNNNGAEESTGVMTMGANFSGSSEIECELSFELVSADLANNDTIDIRLEENDGTDFDTYTETPRITITKSGDVTGTGDLDAQASQADGAGVVRSIGTGTLEAQASAVDGTGAVRSVGTGALESGVSQVDGAGTVADASVDGTGDLQAQASDVAGTGVARSVGSGALAAASSEIDAAGILRSLGTGVLEAQTSEVDGAGTAEWVGTGALAAQAAAVAGVGVVRSIGTGALICGASQVEGLGAGVTPVSALPLDANRVRCHQQQDPFQT